MFNKEVCVIIDAFSTGKHIAPVLIAQGYSCIHIKSSLQLPSKYKVDEASFIINLTFENNLSEILDTLRHYTIRLCIPGYESGVELADLLSEELNLPSNGSKYSLGRRDKFEMNEMVAKANLKTVDHFKSESLLPLLTWASKINKYPLVLKPLDSANGDGVFFCNNEAEITAAFNSITAVKNQFGKQNSFVLAETLNIGHEYIINTVSWKGKHFVAEIWRISRKPYTTIYEKAEIVNSNEAEWQPLSDYTFKVLDALHISYGAGTTEVKYTESEGPVLLETSSRLMGNAPLNFSHKLAGFTQLSLLIEAYLAPDIFLNRINKPRSPMTQQGMAVILISDQAGIIKENITYAFQQLTTLHSYQIEGDVGTELKRTINSLTAPGEIYLIGTAEALAHDYQTIRNIEKYLYQEAIAEPITTYSQRSYPTSAFFQGGGKAIEPKENSSQQIYQASM